ncbi:MAG: tetraether lipid synthase Tes, partial [Candidatus Aenigmatarchaeota archaeon]
ALANVVVTNRCDLTCWYCFFYAKAMGYVYEPTLMQLRQMFKNLRAEKPVPANAVQLTGGEPCIRDDIIEIIEMARQEGFDHVQLNTNGTRFAREPEFADRVKKAGVNTLYLSFDGVTPKTNPKNHWEIPLILERCRNAKIGVVLVPTVINHVNDHEIGKIMKFAVKNIDVIRGIVFQPVSLVGRITKADLKKFRITIPDVIERLEKQIDGAIKKDDFYPIPTVAAITHFVEALKKEPTYELTSHFACGAATYVFIDDDNSIIPVTRFVDVEGLMEYLDEKARELKTSSKTWVLLKMLTKLSSFINKKKQPKNLNLAKMLMNVFKKKDYSALGDIHHKSLLISSMHFMDLYNYDIERVKNCCIHYAQPDGTIVPFCTFNVIPEWYRDKIQRKYSITLKQWEKKNKRKINTDLYKRDVKKLQADPLYNKYYG